MEVFMSVARAEYMRDLVADAQVVSTNKEIISAIVLNDALNGIRKAMLDLAETNRQIADELGAIAEAAKST